MNKQRTPKQNKAAHLFFEQLADAMNEAGFEQKITIGSIDVPWNKDTVKIFFKKIANAQFRKIHTADLTSKEMTEVYETLNRYLASKGLHLPWPSYQHFIKRVELST